MRKLNLKIENIQKHKHLISQVASWIYNEFIEGHIPNCSYLDIVNSLEKRKLSEIPITLVCMLEGKCFGTISLFSNDLSKLKQLSPWLAALYVEKEYRNMGVAKLLISEVEKLTQNLGYTKLYLRTETAGKYYSNLGWKKQLETTDENGIFTSVYMKDI